MKNCDSCMYYSYDEEYGEYFCDVNVDEDEFGRLNYRQNKECPYYRVYDEYKVVKHQM